MSADIKEIHKEFLKSKGICTDTRQLAPECFFVALKGDNFDGNAFVLEALKKGAKTILMEGSTSYNDVSLAPYRSQIFFVDNTLESLQDLARFHRKYLNLPLIALTGSNGKTTTKELLHATLSKQFSCIATSGNLNNHIGVPLTLLRMNKQTEIGIIEMGANHQGEIAELCRIAMPNFGFITNFGKAHLEGFGGEEGVIRGKSELITYHKKNGGLMFIQFTDEKQMQLTQGLNRVIINENVVRTRIESDTEILSISGPEGPINSQMIGSYNVSNIIAAIEIALYFKVPWLKIKNAIEDYQPSMNRSQVIKLDMYYVIMDAYNANPSSMVAALENFSKLKKRSRSTVILGDMLELGKASEREHQAILDRACQLNFDNILLAGSNFEKTHCHDKRVQIFSSYEALEAYLIKEPPSYGRVLIKGSRGMALERLLEKVFVG